MKAGVVPGVYSKSASVEWGPFPQSSQHKLRSVNCMPFIQIEHKMLNCGLYGACERLGPG